MGLEGLGIKRSAVTNYVYRLLSRSRMTLEQLPGEAFLKLVPSLRTSRFSGLVLVEMPGGVIGRLLYQNGKLVYAGQGDLEPQEAFWVIQRTTGESTFVRFVLEPDQALLAYAAVDGIPHTVGMQIPVDGRSLFEEQKRRGFSGVLALEAGSSLLIWHWQAGVIKMGPAQPPTDLERYRLIHIAWSERELPEMILGPAANLAGTASVAQAPAGQGRQAVMVDPNQEIWQAFADLMRRHLADRAPRIVNLMR